MLIVLLLIILIPYGFRLVDMKIRLFAKEVWLKTYPFAAITAIVLYTLIENIYYPTSLIGVSVLGLAGYVIFVLFFYKFGLYKAEKNQIKKYLKSILN